MKKGIKVLIIFVLLVVIITALLFINDKMNNRVFVTEYTFSHPDIPPAFYGSSFMVLSDLHDADFADQIIRHIEKTKPDFLLMTGDMVQLPDSSVQKSLEIAREAIRMGVPVYAVSGNHERQCGRYDEIVNELWAEDVYMLENSSVEFEKNGERILLVGIKDPRHDIVTKEKMKVIRDNIEYELSKRENMFSILLSHREILYPGIKDTGVDLIVSGHSHGGIIRIPFIGGIIGKEEGNDILPSYEYGVIKEDNCATMIVSGGCDKNPGKRRFFNPPELVLITLEGK